MAIASLFLISCDKKDDDSKPQTSKADRKEVMNALTATGKISGAKNSTKHLNINMDAVVKTTKSIGVNTKNSEETSYYDKINTKGKLTKEQKDNQWFIKVTYDKTVEFKDTITGTFDIVLTRVSPTKYEEKRVWDLLVNTNKITGTVIRNINIKEKEYLYEGKSDNFTVTDTITKEVYTEVSTFKEKFPKTEDHIYFGEYKVKSKIADFDRKIEKTVIYDLSWSNFIPIQGVEKITIDDKEFQIDYGKGEKDSKATLIYSNGEKEEFDMR